MAAATPTSAPLSDNLLPLLALAGAGYYYYTTTRQQSGGGGGQNPTPPGSNPPGIVSDPIGLNPFHPGPVTVSRPIGMGPGMVSHPIGMGPGIISHPVGLGPVIVSHPIQTGKPPKVPSRLKVLPPPPPLLTPLPPPIRKKPTPPPPPPPSLTPPVPISGMPGQCVLNLGWITPAQANYGTPLGVQQIACSGPAGPNCTGKIAHNTALAALLPTEQACLTGQPADGVDPDGSKLSGVLLGAYGRRPIMMDGYDAIQAAPFFWYDTTSGVAAYSQNNLQHFNWKPTVQATKLTGWALG